MYFSLVLPNSLIPRELRSEMCELVQGLWYNATGTMVNFWTNFTILGSVL